MKQTVSYLVIEDESGTWVFAVPDLTSVELEVGLARLQKYVTAPGDSDEHVDGATDPIVGRLQRLDELLERGLLTAAEHDQRRASILDAI